MCSIHARTPTIARFQTESDVHLHLFSLSRLAESEREEDAFALLGTSEKEALARIKAAQRKREFLHGRSMLRRLLAAYGDVSPADVAVDTDSAHKPRANARSGQKLPVFNVSHSGDMLVIAVSQEGEVGADVEQSGRALDMDLEAIACRHFTPDEHALLISQPPEDRMDVFLRLWTLKEAILKAIGVGLHQPLSRIRVAEPAERYGVAVARDGIRIWVQATHLQLSSHQCHIAVARAKMLGNIRFFSAD